LNTNKYFIFILLLLLISTSTTAATTKNNTAIGYLISSIDHGLSAKYKLDSKYNFTAQIILDLLGSSRNLSARVNSTIKTINYWKIYGYGQVGYYSRRGRCLSLKSCTDNTLGFAGGTGAELNWQKLNPKLPPLWLNAEIGFAALEYDDINESSTGITLGVGIHYYFDLDSFIKR